MLNQLDVFFGLSSTGWTAISSIATMIAVITALAFPISERINRRKNIFRVIEKEIRTNFIILYKAKNPKYSIINGQQVPVAVLIGYTLEQLNYDYWEDNKQYVSEISKNKYDKYYDINRSLKSLKEFSKEILSSTDNIQHLNKIIIAFENEYMKLKEYHEYW